MGQIKKVFYNMSLKKSLVTIAVFWLGLASLLSMITILSFSKIRENILDTRPIIVSGFEIDPLKRYDTEIENGINIIPQDFTHGDLSKEYQIYYWGVTFLMVGLPISYILFASIFVAKQYYRLKLVKPIKSLKIGMDHISKQDLDFQIEYDSNDELGKLCDTFEYMKNEIHKSNSKMWEMLQERKALTASVSHDLRTPITVIKGYLDYLIKLMDKGVLTEDIIRSTTSNMMIATDRLERYVDCIKDIQKIEDIELNIQHSDLKTFISNLNNEFALLAKQNNKEFEINNYVQSSLFQSDKDMLVKILENIFDNALRFSTKKIILTIKETKDSLLFSMQDDGVGFTSDELTSATSLFYSSPINSGSFGIGLFICKILCEKLGGTLILKNSSIQGAIVIIKIKKYL